MVRRGRSTANKKTQIDTGDIAPVQPSGSHSSPPPAFIPFEVPAVIGWDDIPTPEGGWDDPQDNTWEWEAAGDDSIASDDPHREDKIRWRIEHDHVHSSHYRVAKWLAKLLSYDTPEVIVRPPKDELHVGVGEDRSRSRSRSRGRQGREHRHKAVVAWNDRAKAPKVKAPSVTSEATAHDDRGSSRTRAPSDQLQAWIDSLTKKGNYRNYRHVEKAKALEFFELPLREKVQKVESISRQVGAARASV